MECCRNIMKFIDKLVAQDGGRYLSFSPGSGSSEAGDRVGVLLHDMLVIMKSLMTSD